MNEELNIKIGEHILAFLKFIDDRQDYRLGRQYSFDDAEFIDPNDCAEFIDDYMQYLRSNDQCVK